MNKTPENPQNLGEENSETKPQTILCHICGKENIVKIGEISNCSDCGGYLKGEVDPAIKQETEKDQNSDLPEHMIARDCPWCGKKLLEGQVNCDCGYNRSSKENNQMPIAQVPAKKLSPENFPNISKPSEPPGTQQINYYKLREKNGLGKTEMEEYILFNNKKVYDYLGLNINLEKEIADGNVDFCSREQRKTIKNNILGYFESLIIPGKISREKLIKLFEYKNYGDLSLDEEEKRKLSKTLAAIEPTRPGKFYEILIRPKPEISWVQGVQGAHPETINLSFADCRRTCANLRGRSDYEGLQVKGFNLQEYLFFQTYYFLLHNIHPDNEIRCLLLEEINKDKTECFYAFWSNKNKQIKVGIDRVSDKKKTYDYGARFLITPQKPESDDLLGY